MVRVPPATFCMIALRSSYMRTLYLQLWFLSFFLLFSSPILSGRRLDVYRTSTHDVALERI